MPPPDPMAEAITKKQHDAWERIHNAEDRPEPEPPRGRDEEARREIAEIKAALREVRKVLERLG